MEKIAIAGTIGLCTLTLAIGVSMYGYPLSIYGQKTSGAIFTSGEAAYRARLMAGKTARIGDVRLTTRKDMAEILFGYTGTYPPAGEYAAADAPNGVVLTFDAATGLPGSFGGFTRGRDEEMLKNFSNLENLEGEIGITPLDIRSLLPTDEEVEKEN